MQPHVLHHPGKAHPPRPKPPGENLPPLRSQRRPQRLPPKHPHRARHQHRSKTSLRQVPLHLHLHPGLDLRKFLLPSPHPPLPCPENRHPQRARPFLQVKISAPHPPVVRRANPIPHRAHHAPHPHPSRLPNVLLPQPGQGLQRLLPHRLLRNRLPGASPQFPHPPQPETRPYPKPTHPLRAR
jgi:hypothetical protein